MPDRTILLVEDNAISRKMVSFALETKGYRVLAAADGATALQLMAQRPQLVLLDLVLPDISGFELAPRLRLATTGPIAVLACSGFVSKLEEARLGAAGFDDIITKPIEPSRLLQIVRAHLPEDEPRLDSLGSGQCVLVADDDPVQLKLTMYRLERFGFRTTGACDGIEALERTRTQRPDLVLTDVMMPRLDGFGLCRALRDDPRLASIPVVMTTNTYLEREDRELATQIEADEFVIRTPELHEVVEAIRRCLAQPRLVAEHLSEQDSAARRAEVEAERNRRVMRQLEKQASLNSGLAQRCASLSAELTVLSGMSAALCQGLDVQSALETTLAACLDAGGISQGALYLLERNGTISTRAFGETSAPLEAGELTSFCGRLDCLRALLEQRRTLDLPRDGTPDLPGPIAGLLVPIVHGGTLLGGLFLVSSGQGRASEQTAFAEGVASQILAGPRAGPELRRPGCLRAPRARVGGAAAVDLRQHRRRRGGGRRRGAAHPLQQRRGGDVRLGADERPRRGVGRAVRDLPRGPVHADAGPRPAARAGAAGRGARPRRALPAPARRPRGRVPQRHRPPPAPRERPHRRGGGRLPRHHRRQGHPGAAHGVRPHGLGGHAGRRRGPRDQQPAGGGAGQPRLRPAGCHPAGDRAAARAPDRRAAPRACATAARRPTGCGRSSAT